MDDTRPIRLIPPMMTIATSVAMISPVSQVGAPSVVVAERLTVFAWFMLPLPKLHTTPRNANAMALLSYGGVTLVNGVFAMAIGFHAEPMPRSM